MPWVPREVYDVMVEALRERGAVRVSPAPRAVHLAPDVPVATSTEAPVIGNTAPVAEPPTLADVVAHACVRYAYGSRDEEMANRRIAYEMTRAGQSNSAIIATLRDGASLPAWADTL